MRRKERKRWLELFEDQVGSLRQISRHLQAIECTLGSLEELSPDIVREGFQTIREIAAGKNHDEE